MNNVFSVIPPKNTKNYFQIAVWTVVILFLITLSFGAGLYLPARSSVVKGLAEKEVVFLGKLTGQYSQPGQDVLRQDVDFQVFWNVWDLLKKNYVDRGDLTDKKMFYGALRGLVSSTGDPYTVFMDPVVAQTFQDDLAGTFEGIGAEIGIKNDVLTVIAPLPDMPAEKAGLRAQDKILAINGESTQGMSADSAVERIRGEKGTEVKLMIWREGFEAAKEFSIKRDKIVVKSVRQEMREDGIYAITITNFNNDTVELFKQTVREAVEKNPKGLILDVRNNPGGYLEAAIDVASEWIAEGTVVVEKFSEENQNQHLAKGRARLENIKTVVLANEGSASASEIVAGALRDTGKATIIGQKTFGKGSVQQLETLPDGSSVKITVAKWLTPKGTSINDEGIVPDIPVELTAEDYNNSRDPQLEIAVRFLKGELPRAEIEKLKNAASSTAPVAKEEEKKNDKK